MSDPVPLRPLVVGVPRSGFALLCSVLIHFVPFAPSKWDRRQQILNTLVERLGSAIPVRMIRAFRERGIPEEELIYNDNFRLLVGGPKWLKKDNDELACFRKYFGAKGRQDFTLVIAHPRELLDYYEVVHSHNDPARWPMLPAYRDYTKFASIRNPLGILNSSCFSINALTSEYIQRFVPPERDNHALREELALFKFTHIEFFEGLVKFLARYLEEFASARHHYHVMRWEDLITDPHSTILRLGEAAGIPVDAGFAAEVWKKLDHRNLTGAHKHNLRAGKGKVGDWRNWLTNAHLEIARHHGIEHWMEELGYGRIESFDERDYTPFQKRVAAALERGEVIDETEDRDLFGFAFNKSNLDSSKFPFRQHDWKEWTRIERSCFEDEDTERYVWDAAEQIAGHLNGVFQDVLDMDCARPESARSALDGIRAKYELKIAPELGTDYGAAFRAAGEILESPRGGRRSRVGHLARVSRRLQRMLRTRRRAAAPPARQPPRLVRSVGSYNVVLFDGRFYALPRALGEVDMVREDVNSLPGVVSHRCLQVVESEICAG